MRLYTLDNTWIIEAPGLVGLAGWLTTGTHGWYIAKAFAWYPFVVVRSREVVTPLLLNHERIHIAQQKELLFVGLILLTILEDLYGYTFLRKRGIERYLWRSSEQECYRHQHDATYLQYRPRFTVFSYIRNKKRISFVPEQAPAVTIHD